MWQELRLRKLGVIDEAELTLDPGFTVVTGETGAGKTMLVTALGLLRGGKADPGLVRRGADQARVEARVCVQGHGDAGRLVEEAGGEVEDAVVIVARTVGAGGRSRAHLGGASVPAAVLAGLGDLLVAVHGQSEQLRLRRPGAQREALDRFAGAPVADLLARYRPAHQRLTTLRRELAELRRAADDRAREIVLLRAGLDEITAVAPEDGEDERLLHEEGRLAHAEGLRAAATEARTALSGDAGEVLGAADAVDLLARARAALEAVREHDPAVAGLADRAAELAYAGTDLASDLAGYADGVDIDPVRLAVVQERRAVLTALTRRYGPTLADVRRWADQGAVRLERLERADDTIATLAGDEQRLLDELNELADDLTRAREGAAGRLAAEVTTELQALAMPSARFVARVTPTDEPGADSSSTRRLGPDGGDDVELLLAANAGADLRPLARGASGGELSRVMLALEVALATTSSVPTFVFDEVDAGIGGRAAVEVGRRLARLARHAQVLAVTHLPQVAAFADRHYLVDKSDAGTVTTSGVRALDGADRVRELSRMLAGLDGSAAAAAHAEELLDLAATERR